MVVFSDVGVSVGHVLSGMKDRLAALTEQEWELQEERKQVVRTLLERWVPDLSRGTAERLFHALPAMKTSAVRAQFRQRKTLGVWPSQTYREALRGIRHTLAEFLKAGGLALQDFPDAPVLDALVARRTELETEKNTLEQQAGTLRLVHALESTAHVRKPADAKPSPSVPAARPRFRI